MRRVGNEIIDRIRQRTIQGISKTSKPFKGYSKSYKKLTGKSNPPDLVLEGKMLGSLVIKKITENTLTVGLKGNKQQLKAENHIHGVTLPKRDFLGLPQKELNDIKEEFE